MDTNVVLPHPSGDAYVELSDSKKGNVCNVSGCSLPVFVKKFSLCRAHYRVFKKAGEMPTEPVLRKNPSKNRRGYACSVLDCERKGYAKGYCSGHYNRFRLHGDAKAGILLRGRKTNVYCLVETCTEASFSSGLCCNHFYKSQEYSKKEARALSSAEWARENKDKISSYVTVHAQKYPERIRRSAALSGAKRRASILDDTTLDKEVSLDFLVRRDGPVCSYCLVGLNLDNRKDFSDSAHIDHIVPLSSGGTHTKDNVVLACRSCNLSKGSMSVLNFLSRKVVF